MEKKKKKKGVCEGAEMVPTLQTDQSCGEF